MGNVGSSAAKHLREAGMGDDQPGRDGPMIEATHSKQIEVLE